MILHPALSVRLSVGWLVGWLVGWSVSQLYFIFFVLYSLTLLLLPKCSSDLRNDPCLSFYKEGHFLMQALGTYTLLANLLHWDIS